MSSLIVFHQSSPEVPNKLLTHAEDIASTLATVAIQFAEVPVQTKVVAGTPGEELLQASKVQLEQLQAAYGMACAQVLSVSDERGEKGTPLADSLRQEQRCASAQVVYCLAGRGQLMLHIAEHVYAVVLERQGLLVLPAGTAFWFDGGEHPRFALARLFDAPHVPSFEIITGDFAERFFRFDQF